jgi:hypothetical protein
MRWPSEWKDPALLDLLRDTPFDYLLFDKPDLLPAVINEAQKRGLKASGNDSIPAAVTIVKGDWPGVKMTSTGMVDRASAGPTGAPWVDSNGWKIRLAAALHPGGDIWVDSLPQKPRLFAESYQIGIADAAAHGGRWIISIDEELAAGIGNRKAAALATWKKILAASGFFAEHRTWGELVPEAVLGIISDFTGKNEFMNQELLNLVARTNQQYRIILKNVVNPSAIRGLKAVIYADEEGPSQDVRDQILVFVRAGGLLITGPKWGQLPPEAVAAPNHPRYLMHTLGKGRVAIAQPDFEDPYIAANDASILMSHRFELLRFWNVGAVGSCFTMVPDRKRAVIQILFYAAAYFGNPTLRVSGRYRSARLWTFDKSEARNLEIENHQDAIELHMPPVSQYAAVELEL